MVFKPTLCIHTQSFRCTSTTLAPHFFTGNNGKQTYLKNVLHVPTITKHLISVGQIVEQGMQVRFNNDGCFIERIDQIVAHGHREGRMFILTSNEVKSAMFAMDLKVEYDLKHAIYKSRIRIPELYHEGDYGGMRSVPVRKATPTSIFERAEFEQRDTGCRPLRCMGTSPDNHTRRIPILRHVH